MLKLTTAFAGMLLAAAAMFTMTGSSIQSVADDEGAAIQGGQTNCSGFTLQQVGCGTANCQPGSTSDCQTVGIWNPGGTKYGTVSNGTAKCYACGTFSVKCGSVTGDIFYTAGCGS
jgi:hypothetical protein